MKEREINIAKEFNITDNINKLEKELLQVDGVIDVEFDLFGFYDNMNQVIFLAKYDIPVSLENYFPERRRLVNEVIITANNNGLKRTGDSIEDYGEHFYFVMECDKSWIKERVVNCEG